MRAYIESRLEDWSNCDFVFTEEDVDRATVASVGDNAPAVFTQIKLLLGKYEREFAASGNRDANQEALEQVERVTESGPVDGEELLGSEELKRQYREAKRRLADDQRTPRK